jgi:hypothetical protein
MPGCTHLESPHLRQRRGSARYACSVGAPVFHGHYYFSGVVKGLVKVSSKGSHLVAQDSFGLVCFLILLTAALFAAALLSRFLSSPGPSDSASNGGGGGGSPPLPRGPGPGGVPLDDARPARVRLRDERRLALRLAARERRRTKEPGRTPTRASRTSGEYDRHS